MNAPTIRDLRWQDIPTIAALDAQLFADDAWSEATWWAELAERPRRSYAVLTDEAGEILGYGGLDVSGELADIMSVAVAPSAQGRGLGRVMLAELHRRATARAAAYLLLEVRSDNLPARALYERAGYERIHVRERYYQPGDVDALIMRKTLGAHDVHA